ncbi:insulin-induced protein-domain-containing protein [Tricladium varicosporioides]|nr:insulin-induced protein-domain-containing protein [Hymenoscyphus varicosporioides]
MSSGSPKIYRPKPRRPFGHNAAPLQPPSPLLAPAAADETPSRSHSVLNLTSSTLLGIYSPTGYQSDRDYETSTPWGTGAETPVNGSFSLPPQINQRSLAPPPAPSTLSTIFSLGLRSILLFGMGMGYGVLVRHLHDDRQLAPFQVEGIMKPTHDWRYLVFWGISGVLLGSLLPWIDTMFSSQSSASTESVASSRHRNTSPGRTVEDEPVESVGTGWNQVVRSIGAFMGIAFAIRKLPWSSNLQASLTLFLVNPVLWYIIDRSTPGFILSSAVGATGTAVLLASNPSMMPSPGSSGYRANNTIKHTNFLGDLNLMGIEMGEYVSRESFEGGIWILSVLFCSCVCFGNIGRRLALSGRRERSATPSTSINGYGNGGARVR